MNHGRIIIDLPKKTRDRLTQFALRYGFSLEEFSSRMLEQLSTEIPEESLKEYKNAKGLRASLTRALRDYEAGRVHRRL